MDSLGRTLSVILGMTVVVGVIVLVLMPSAEASCGDYDRADFMDTTSDGDVTNGPDGHSYEYVPGDGDYERTSSGEFEYVGCADGAGGSGGGSGGWGDLFRGGGPGLGK